MSISSYLALIIIVIVINALKSAQKKKEAEEARRMPTAKAQQPKQSAPKVHSQPIVPTPAPMPAHAHTTVMPRSRRCMSIWWRSATWMRNCRGA